MLLFLLGQAVQLLQVQRLAEQLAGVAMPHRAVEVELVEGCLPESFNLTLSSDKIVLSAGGQSAVLYGYLQILKRSQLGQLPLTGFIRQSPALEHRGLMIDSARHFLSLDSLKRTVSAMALARLNVLHWHIADDESFPLEIKDVPQLQSAGSFSARERYSQAEIKELVQFAKARGVKIVPEIDSPAHVRSWGLSQKYSAMVIQNCPGGEGYNAQLDLSNGTTFTVATAVIRELQDLFETDLVHLGGDQVFGSCWDLRPSIKKFMAEKGIASYGELQTYWRNQTRKGLPAGTKAVFWRNDAAGVQTQEQDLLQYWGATADIPRILNGSKNKVILSESDLLYINKGVGFIYGNDFGVYSTWQNIYNKFEVAPNGIDPARVYGVQACLWGEVSNEDTLDSYLWMRGAALGIKAWEGQARDINVVKKELAVLMKGLIANGVGPSPLDRQVFQ